MTEIETAAQVADYGDITHIQVVPTKSGKFVYEARNGGHAAVETSKEYAKEAAAHQAGADAYPGIPVRHAVVNDGKPEYGENDGPGEGTVQ